MIHQTWETLKNELTAGLKKPLPGFTAQKALAPRVLNGPYLRDGNTDQKDAVPAAALLLLFPVEDAPHLVLTVRSQDLTHHSGQISLPGGLKESGETLVEAALRETKEEIGVEPADITLTGSLSPIYIPPSKFLLHPFVGIVSRRPEMVISEREVARVMEISVQDLGHPGTIRREIRPLKGRGCMVPYFALNGEKVWGATAMILAELLWILGYQKPEITTTS